jgi:hypothetical protein
MNKEWENSGSYEIAFFIRKNYLIIDRRIALNNIASKKVFLLSAHSSFQDCLSVIFRKSSRRYFNFIVVGYGRMAMLVKTSTFSIFRMAMKAYIP